MGDERDKSSKRRGGGEKRENQGGRGITKVTKVVKMMTMKNKNVDPGKMKINCTNTTQ